MIQNGIGREAKSEGRKAKSEGREAKSEKRLNITMICIV